jgi:DNA-binding PadR family transcriptional regulator
MSDGNLITHLRALDKAGFVFVNKEMSKKRPQSNYALTKAGKKAFEEYLTVLEQIVNLSKND